MNPPTARLRVSDLKPARDRLRIRLARLKRDNPQSFDWYSYDSLTNIDHLTRLLGDRYEYLLDAARSRGVLDLACADGDMSWLFETLGCKATAIDYPPTNRNGMQGVHALKRLLNSQVEIREANLDEQFELPNELSGLTLFMGVLYHLKNPFHALEKLARHSKYCVMNTRVARYFPGGIPIPADQPVAYLVDENELNNDATNYWIFSHAGLNRLLSRTHWEVLESFAVGQTAKSDPVRPRHDERIVCLLKSRFALPQIEYLEGWHHVEEDGWRWTQSRFSARVFSDGELQGGRLALDLVIPQALFSRTGPIKLSAALNGEPLPPSTMSAPGAHRFLAPFRPGTESAVFTFALDKYLPPDDRDPRERGIVVAGVEVE